MSSFPLSEGTNQLVQALCGVGLGAGRRVQTTHLSLTFKEQSMLYEIMSRDSFQTKTKSTF